MWKWMLRLSALPKRWIEVTAPVWAVCFVKTPYRDGTTHVIFE
jgi:hypothetical protein